MPIGSDTYLGWDNIREDLLSVLKDVSPLDGNYLTDHLGSSEASSTLHQWEVFNLTRATSVTFSPEGAEATTTDLSHPSRSTNYTAILNQVVKVTGSNEVADTAVGGDPMAFHKRNALRILKQKMEWAIINGASKVSGSSGVAREMAGLEGTISTNVTARASGTSMSVQEIEDMMQDVWDDVGDGFMGRTMLVPMGIKRTISGFSTNITNYVNDTDNLYRNISVFEGSTGQIKVIPHKDVRNTAGTVAVYLINEEMFKQAFYRKPFFKELASTGDYEWGEYITEFTLESLAQITSAKRTGYKKEPVYA